MTTIRREEHGVLLSSEWVTGKKIHKSTRISLSVLPEPGWMEYLIGDATALANLGIAHRIGLITSLKC